MSQRETGTEARQGKRGTRVLGVLLVAVLLAVAAGGALLVYQGSQSPQTDRSSQTRASEDASNPTPAQPKP